MANLETTYMGIKLQSPIIVSSSGLTNSVEKVKRLAKAGAGAIVLKSLFEEQIMGETNELVVEQGDSYPEALDYIQTYVRSQSVSKYIDLIRECKAATNIPIIASINCSSIGEWTEFSRTLQDAGADAIELNIFVMNTGQYKSSADYEQVYYNIVKEVKSKVQIPIAVKLGFYFSSLVHVVEQLYANGASAVVAFNRFYQPDIDISKMELVSGEVYSSPTEISRTLRWTAILSGKLKNLEISASTGIHDWDGVLKCLLAGAQTVQVCSAIYKGGNDVIGYMNTCIDEWMDQNNYDSIDNFRGKLDYSSIGDSTVYERAQFMKYFSNKK